MYAVNTQLRCETPFNWITICGMAVDTMVWSNADSNMAVITPTRIIVRFGFFIDYFLLLLTLQHLIYDLPGQCTVGRELFVVQRGENGIELTDALPFQHIYLLRRFR